jgi:hypothetical protein
VATHRFETCKRFDGRHVDCRVVSSVAQMCLVDCGGAPESHSEMGRAQEALGFHCESAVWSFALSILAR